MDIDFITDFSSGAFQITLGDNPQSVMGNRKLVNRFEITFLTALRQFVIDGRAVTDNYGGNAPSFINKPQATNDLQGITASLNVASDQTVQCILAEQQQKNIPDTERLISAELVSVDVIGDTVSATIKINPVTVESYQDLIFNFPVITA